MKRLFIFFNFVYNRRRLIFIKIIGDVRMEMNTQTQSAKQRNTGYFAFFLSGICAISSGVVVSLLQELYGFDYGMTGTLLSLMSIGNLIAGFAAGILPAKISLKKTVLLLTIGYFAGYLLMGLSSLMAIFMLAFFIAGVAKGSTINICTILVRDNSENGTKGMNLMHSCYALGALLCPFFIGASAKFNSHAPMFVLAFCGLLLWLSFASVSLRTRSQQKEGSVNWSFLNGLGDCPDS